MTEVVRAEGLSKSYGGTRALRDVSLALDGPGLIGVLGPNGAGKTTLLDILEGLSEPTSGRVLLFGSPLAARSYPRRRVGVVLQRELVLEGMTAREYAELFAAIYRVRGGAEDILGRAGLHARAKVAVSRLSGGEAQRLFIAAASVHAPELLFLDEPTAHLDPDAKAAVGEMLRAMSARATVVMTTHDLSEADRLCDRVVFLDDGEVRAAGTRDELAAAVPEGAPKQGIEGAFHHFCGKRIGKSGDAL